MRATIVICACLTLIACSASDPTRPTSSATAVPSTHGTGHGGGGSGGSGDSGGGEIPVALHVGRDDTTLVAGSETQSGYDFAAGAYRGKAGGDLYFYYPKGQTEGGAFWANNYDQRGVANLGPCATLDSVSTLPATGYDRMAVTATVGDCYAAPLHANNREGAVFRVGALTPTTVALTWKLLPVPVEQLAWRHCEAWRNPSPVVRTTTTAALSSWLARHTSITDAMQWITQGATTPPATVAYDAWPGDMQSSLLENFVAYWGWYAAGMSGADPTPVADPPANQFSTGTHDVTTVLAPADAQALYVKYVALSLVVELQNRVQWSLLDFDAASLAELLDSRKFFTRYTTGGYELIPMSVVPAPPLTAAAYVARHDFLCSTRVASIAETVFWARNLTHYNNGADPAQDELDFWQYAGNPPASRVLAGTRYSGARPGVPTNLTQWTLGCRGTTGLFKSLLRTINIPVEEFSNFNPSVSEPKNALYHSGHAVPHFISEHLWLSHGDDPYVGSGYQDILPFPLQSMEIGDSQFFEWFPNNGPSSNTLPIGRQADEVWLGYGDQPMLVDRLKDLQNSSPPSDANFCKYIDGLPGPPNNYYSCEEAEADGPVARVDALVAPYVGDGGSASLSSDLQGVPLYFFPEAQFRTPPCDTCATTICAANASCCTAWDGACQVLAKRVCGDACIY